MFVGHFAVAFAGKRAAPEASLGTLVLGAQFLDLLWPLFLLFGWERVRIDPGNTVVTPLDFVHYPYTHSLAAAIAWAALLGLIYFYRRRRLRLALVLSALVLSHWFLDFVTHGPDLPLWPGGAKAGLGLWNSLPGTMIVELGLYAVGVGVYLKATSPRRGKKTWGPWGLVTVLFVIQLSTYFGPPPPSDLSVMLAGLGIWIVVPWAFWVDRRREGKAFRSEALYRLVKEAR